MDFVVGLPRTQKSYDSRWVLVDKFNRFACFILFKLTYLAEDYTTIFIDDIVCCHGTLLSIILDRGEKFTSRFWRSLQKGFGTKVKWSTPFYPQTDG